MADLSMVFDLLAKDRASSEVDKVGDSMRGAGDQADALGDRVRGMFGVLAGAAAGAGLAVGAAFGSALEQEGAGRDLGATLGLDPARQAELGRLAGEVFAGNYGDSMEAATGAIGAVVSSIDGMRDASSAAVQATTQDALNFASAFDTDVNGAVGTVGQLIRQGLVADATQGFDLMTAAYQRVPAAMREELPAILSEYGVNFQQLGYTGEQAFGLLTAAAEQGPFVLDKTGDALKELSIRATDMSAASVAAYEAAGLNAEDMAAKILQGGPAAQEATQQIAQGLLDIEDPVARSNAAIGLFGTPLEDLGVTKIPAFLDALAGVGPGMTDAGGSAAALDATLAQGIGPRLETLKRGAQVAAGEGLQALLDGFTQGSTDAGGWQGSLQNLASTVSGTFGPALSTVAGFVTDDVLPALGDLSSWMTENQTTVSVIAGLISGVLALAFTVWGTRAIIAAGQNALAWLSVVTSSQTGAAATQRSALQVVARWAYMSVAAVLHGAKVAAVWTVQMVAAAARGAASLAMSAARVVAGWVLMSAQAVLHGARIGAVWTAQMVAAAARGAASLAVSAARVVGGWVLMGAQSLLQAARMAAAWLIAMGPVGWIIAAVVGLVALIIANWDKVKAFTVGAFQAIVGAVSGAFTSVVNAVSSGVSTAVSFVSGLPGKILGYFSGLGSSLYQSGVDMIQGLLNGAGSLLRNIGRFFLNLVPGWIRGPFESALGISSPSKVFRQYGVNIGQGLVNGLSGSSKEVASASKKLAESLTKGHDAYVAKRGKLIDKWNDQQKDLQRALARRDKGAADAVRRAREAIGKTNKAIRELHQQYGPLANTRGVQAAVAALRVGDDKLIALAKQREATTKRLEAARERLADAVKMRNDFAASVRDSALQFASITDIKTAGSPRVLVDELQQRLTAIRTFRANLAKLAKMGVSQDVYKQIAEAGVEAGGATADALLAGGPKTIKQVNDLQSKISGASKGLGSDSSKRLYQAGVNAAQGLVDGLNAKGKHLEQAAERLASRLTDAVKRRLGIRSPSRVFEGVGHNIGQGLADGIKSMQPVVASELAALADSQAVQSLQASVGLDTGAPRAGTVGYTPPEYDTSGAGAAASTSSSRTVTVSGVVGPAEVAALVAREQRRDEFLAGAGT